MQIFPQMQWEKVFLMMQVVLSMLQMARVALVERLLQQV
jgi:hypothetical protein